MPNVWDLPGAEDLPEDVVQLADPNLAHLLRCEPERSKSIQTTLQINFPYMPCFVDPEE